MGRRNTMKPETTSNDAVDEQEVIQNFYELLMHCLTDEDKQDFGAKQHVADFMQMLSDSVSFCSFEESKKECNDRKEILAIVNEHNESNQNQVYQGFEVTLVVDEKIDWRLWRNLNIWMKTVCVFRNEVNMMHLYLTLMVEL